MNWKKVVTGLAAVLFVSAPARAGGFGVYGSYWNSDQADSSSGGGGKIGFTFVKFLELEFHGTYYPSFTTDVAGQAVHVEGKPGGGGPRGNLLPTAAINPYVGGGGTHYFLDSDQGASEHKRRSHGQAEP